MADNYLQFSEVIPNLAEPEEAWLKEQLQPIRVFGEREYPEDAMPTELADTEPDWSGIRFLRNKTDYDPHYDMLGFGHAFHEDRDSQGWGRHLWFYAEECGNPATSPIWSRSSSEKLPSQAVLELDLCRHLLKTSRR